MILPVTKATYLEITRMLRMAGHAQSIKSNGLVDLSGLFLEADKTVKAVVELPYYRDSDPREETWADYHNYDEAERNGFNGFGY